MHMPHIGETVLVHHKDCFSNGARTVPAIVQQVMINVAGPTLLNLVAFPPFSVPKNLGSVAWYSSTPMIPDDEHFVGAWPRNTHHGHIGQADVGEAA
jgi:hypothetical protein